MPARCTICRRFDNDATETDPYCYHCGAEFSFEVPTVGPRSLRRIALEICEAWGKVNFAARPYLEAMLTLSGVGDYFGNDSGREIVVRFLSNASSFRGGDARRLKAELRAML